MENNLQDFHCSILYHFMFSSFHLE